MHKTSLYFYGERKIRINTEEYTSLKTLLILDRVGAKLMLPLCSFEILCYDIENEENILPQGKILHNIKDAEIRKKVESYMPGDIMFHIDEILGEDYKKRTHNRTGTISPDQWIETSISKSIIEKYFLSISFLFDHIIRRKNQLYDENFKIRKIKYTNKKSGDVDRLYVRIPEKIELLKNKVNNEDYSNLLLLNGLLQQSFGYTAKSNLRIINQVTKQYHTFTETEKEQLLDNNIGLIDIEIIFT